MAKQWQTDGRLVGRRAELAPYTDHWMMGDRYGTIVATNPIRQKIRIKMDKSGHTLTLPHNYGHMSGVNDLMLVSEIF